METKQINDLTFPSSTDFDINIMSSLHWKDEDFYTQNTRYRVIRDACILRVNWEALCQYASSRNSNKPCTFLPESTMGGIHFIRLLSFGNISTKWIARVQLEPSTLSTVSRLRAEIDTMELVRARTKIPIPRVFGYELDDANVVGAAFILMELLPGSSAMDADGGYEVHQGQVLPARRASFYDKVAGIQAEMTSIRLPMIGSIIKRDDNSFDVGPLPGLGGPFSTATEFFKAWTRQAKFPYTDDTVRRWMTSGPVDEVISSINVFPDRLQELACNISANDNGPFPLYHPDFYHSNIIVNDDFDVLGVIDWEGASTVPWELVEPPLFLGIVPPRMDDPNNYEPSGLPKNENTRLRLCERSEYIERVRKKEEELNMDGKLSETLQDPDVQGIAFAIKVYLDPGKLGFYCNILEPFDPLS